MNDISYHNPRNTQKPVIWLAWHSKMNQILPRKRVKYLFGTNIGFIFLLCAQLRFIMSTQKTVAVILAFQLHIFHSDTAKGLTVWWHAVCVYVMPLSSSNIKRAKTKHKSSFVVEFSHSQSMLIFLALYNVCHFNRELFPCLHSLDFKTFPLECVLIVLIMFQ